ncbi:MAG: hypothetical protein BK997_00310 [Candidatus Micrarchaeum sp. ARMAN-1]|nr:MAG: hypothetical protein BK997_00310 [Candidatus Micrarchaeum sp. ARMAN-1]
MKTANKNDGENTVTALEKTYKKLKMQNKLFNEDAKRYESNLSKIMRIVEKLNSNSEYKYLLNLEESIDELNITSEKVITTEKKTQKIKLTEFENTINNSKIAMNQIKRRDLAKVIIDEELLEAKRNALDKNMENIDKYNKYISELQASINLGIKEYTEDEIYKFNEEVNDYLGKIDRLNTEIFKLETKSTGLEETNIISSYAPLNEYEIDKDTDEIANLRIKVNSTIDTVVDIINDEIDNKKTLMAEYYGKVNKLKKLVKEDEIRLTEEEMAYTKLRLSKLLKDLDIEEKTKIGLNSEIKMLIESVNSDRINMINILKLKIIIAKNNISIINTYVKLHKHQLKDSKDSVINKYKDDKSGSIKNYLKIVYKKATL